MNPDQFVPDFVGAAASLGEDVAVIKTPEGRGLVLPRSLTKLPADAQELAADLQRAALELEQLQAQLDELVHDLRSAGGSWALVGWCVGTTGEAARQRWGLGE